MFRFAAFGAGDTTSLRAYRQDVKGGEDNDNNHDDDNSPTVNIFLNVSQCSKIRKKFVKSLFAKKNLQKCAN